MSACSLISRGNGIESKPSRHEHFGIRNLSGHHAPEHSKMQAQSRLGRPPPLARKTPELILHHPQLCRTGVEEVILGRTCKAEIIEERQVSGVLHFTEGH